MRYSSLAFKTFAAAGALICTGALAGCNQSQVQAIGRAEQFDFNFLLLQPDATGKLVLKLNLTGACRDFHFSETELADMLLTKQLLVANVAVPFGFDKICQNATEVKFTTEQLSQAVTQPNGNPVIDANGNPVRRRPHVTLADVVTELSPGGVMEVAVFGIKVNGTTISRTNAPGPIGVTSAEVPSGQVGVQSELFSLANSHPAYGEAHLTNVLTNPNRFTAEFSFLAKTDPASSDVLLVYDGDMVLRTDIED